MKRMRISFSLRALEVVKIVEKLFFFVAMYKRSMTAITGGLSISKRASRSNRDSLNFISRPSGELMEHRYITSWCRSSKRFMATKAIKGARVYKCRLGILQKLFSV